MRPGAGSGETSHERNGTRHTEHPLRGGSRPAWTTLRGSKWSASSASKGSLQQREARAPGPRAPRSAPPPQAQALREGQCRNRGHRVWASPWAVSPTRGSGPPSPLPLSAAQSWAVCDPGAAEGAGPQAPRPCPRPQPARLAARLPRPGVPDPTPGLRCLCSAALLRSSEMPPWDLTGSSHSSPISLGRKKPDRALELPCSPL